VAISRLLKKSFSMEKSCENPNEIEGQFSKTWFFQRPVSSRMLNQNRLLGLVRPNSQFFRVPKLTPSFSAKVPRFRLNFNRYCVSNAAKDWVLFWQGGESTLVAFITRWQKGFKRDPFRQFVFQRFIPKLKFDKARGAR